MKIQLNTEGKLTRARTQLLLNQPFFGTLCLRLKLMASTLLPTAATDGSRIVYNSAFVDSLNPLELQAVLAHEVLHCALGHHCRRGERDPRLWNEAADFAINPILVKNGFTLPADALLDSSFDNLSAEEIYSRLLQRQQKDQAPNQTPDPQAGTSDAESRSPGGECADQAHGSSDDAILEQTGDAGDQPTLPSQRGGGFGEVLDANDENDQPASQAERSRQQHEWSIAADQAIRSAKACGHEPADMDRRLSDSRQSKQDWRAILRDFVIASAPADYRWTPPNRRYIAAGLYLPSVDRSGIGPIVIAVDTSGSVGEEELEQFAGEISAISEEAQPEAIHVVYCDAAVQSWQEFLPSDPIDLKPKGGGGTDFRPVFDWIDTHQLAPACLIYLTDLCCNSYPNPPEYPVLWVTNSRNSAPFGETVRVDLV